MTWNSGDTWTRKIKFNPSFEFKLAVMYSDIIKKWEPSENRVYDFKSIKEVMLKCRTHKNIKIDSKMTLSYDFNSKLMTIVCKWQ